MESTITTRDVEKASTKETINTELVKNHTYCMDGDTAKMAKEVLCLPPTPPMDSAATGVIIGTVLILVIVLAILAILFYKWYSQDRIKREQLKRFDKRWRFAYPQTTQYK